MANWAKLQEDITGLPVAKRARNSIHFDKGGGEILAEFVGKPCHYLDGGIWKPIDTKLLLRGDGYYGCPHSKVKVKPDGTVAVEGTDYLQRTELPTAQTGLIDGDKLIRKFSFGEQRMWVTEDGFRSEIQLNRIPTLTEAKKLIATESGTLSREYLKSLTTATDANGDERTFTTLTAFRTWLASAVFPVVIDPDFSTSGSNADYFWAGRNADYSTARSTLWNTYWTTSFNNLYIGQNFSGGLYYVYRVYLSFDTSSIDDGETIAQVNLKLTYKSDLSSVDFDVQIAKLSTVSYAGALSATLDDNIWGNGNGKTPDTQYVSGNLSTAWINKTGLTKYALRSSKDSDNTAPSGSEYCSVYDYEAATESYRPVLTVTYSAGGVPKHFMHYQRMRSL